ncbi:CDP-alcohol phosphatidyltransferase family protein [soil metagenome]|nr:CDP-alcohol phosphatidyltransferase family protein [Gemmatimonadota bacterium]
MPLRPQWAEQLVIRTLSPITDALIRARVHPNAITTLGFFVGISSAWAFAQGQVRLAGMFILIGGAFDIFDGRVARGTGLASTFGSFYDSTLDRISEIIVFVGVLAFFLRDGSAQGDVGIIYAVLLALGGSLMVSYTRARAEALGLDCKVGLMQRAERVIALGAAALLFGTMWDSAVLRGAIILIAVLANFTAFQRIVWVYRHTRIRPGGPLPARRPDSTKFTGKRL